MSWPGAALIVAIIATVALNLKEVEARNTKHFSALWEKRNREREDALIALPQKVKAGQLESDNIPPSVWAEIRHIRLKRRKSHELDHHQVEPGSALGRYPHRPGSD